MYTTTMNNWLLVMLIVLAGIQNVHAAPNSCSVGSSAVSFGSYDATAGLNLLATGTVNLSCNNNNVHVVLKLSVGNGAGASYASGRRMTRSGGSETLIYNLYADSGRTQIFGDGSGSSVTLPVVINRNLVQTIWARIPGSQTATLAGSYSDTVIVTITY